MSTFSDWNGPQTGSSVNAMAKFATEYQQMRGELAHHKEATAVDNGPDVHGIKAYVTATIKDTANKADISYNTMRQILKVLAGYDKETVKALTINDVKNYFDSKLDNKDLITFILALQKRIVELETALNKLSLIQFDNVPVGAGIRWYRETLPEDGTYVWARGQTLYGVNQNFPELARAWELDGADNVVVPQEDHTIFKVRKATVKIRPVEHAFIDEAPGDISLEAISTMLETIQQAVDNLTAADNQSNP